MTVVLNSAEKRMYKATVKGLDRIEKAFGEIECAWVREDADEVMRLLTEHKLMQISSEIHCVKSLFENIIKYNKEFCC